MGDYFFLIKPVMKPTSLLSFLALLLFAIPWTVHAENVLIDKNLKGGGFEDKTLAPWVSSSDAPGCTLESNPARVREGKQSCRVSLQGKPGGRATARLIQNIDPVLLADGGHFVITLDAATIPDRLPVKICAELVFMDGSTVLKSLPFEVVTPDSKSWSEIKLSSSDEVPSDWTEGKVQVRLIFFVDNGTEGELYELLVDNISLVQSQE